MSGTVMIEANVTVDPGDDSDLLLASDSPAWRPLTPLLAAAAFAVTAMTLVGSLLAA
jgi:hypothetical protein